MGEGIMHMEGAWPYMLLLGVQENREWNSLTEFRDVNYGMLRLTVGPLG